MLSVYYIKTIGTTQNINTRTVKDNRG